MKTITTSFLYILILLPLAVFAQDTGGLVTCSGLDCNLCSFSLMVDRIVDFLVAILIIISIILIAVTGIQLASSGGNESAKNKAKERLQNVIIGFILVLASWTIVDTLLKALVTDGDINLGVWNEVGGPNCGGLYIPESSFENDNPQSGIVMPLTNIPGIVETGEEVCFPGDGTSGQICFEKIEVPNEGDYRFSDGAPAGYTRPGYFIDLTTVNPDTPISEHFTVGELAQVYKGRYAYIDPNMISGLEGVRSDIGTVNIVSGYRPPGYNRQLIEESRARNNGESGVAEHSRHQYGDAVDIGIGSGQSASAIRNSCRANGATYCNTYSTHVHCDWRPNGPNNC